MNMDPDMAEIAPLNTFGKATATAQYIQISLPLSLRNPHVGIICGSGLGGLADTIHPEPKHEVAYTDIPHFPVSTGMSTGNKICNNVRFLCEEARKE